MYTHLHEIHRCLRALQLEPSPAFDQAIYKLAHAIQDPGPFYTLSHCDAGPHNILVVAKQPILIDFESACFQHGFVDLVQARMGFPSAGMGRRIPPAVITQMELAYREALVEETPEAADDQLFGQALAEGCAQIVLTLLAELGQSQPAFWFAPSAVTPQSTYQMQRLNTYLQAFVHIATSWKQLPTIRTVVEQIIDRIVRDWHGIDMLPYYPVFQVIGQQ